MLLKKVYNKYKKREKKKEWSEEKDLKFYIYSLTIRESEGKEGVGGGRIEAMLPRSSIIIFDLVAL